MKMKRGDGCSRSGNKYERMIYDIVSNTLIGGNKFNTQYPYQLGGSLASIDIVCNYTNENDIGIEIKKSRTPDWCQCSLKFDKENERWIASNRGKNTKKRDIYSIKY